MKTYKITYQEKGQIKTLVLKSENIHKESLPLNILSIIPLRTKNRQLFQKRVSSSEVLALFNELNIMLQANILFNDAVDILYKNTHNPQLKEVLFSLLHALQNGQELNTALQPYEKIIGSLPLVFLKIAQDNGNLKTIMNSLVLVLKRKQHNKETLSAALRYPLVLSVALLFLTLFSFYFVIPKFEHLFLQYESNLPWATQGLLNFKYFIHHYFFYIFAGIIGVFFLLLSQYQSNHFFKYKIDKWAVLKIPLLSRVLFYTHFQLFFLCVTILLNDKYTFQTAFLNAKVLMGNNYLKAKLKVINQQIQSGKPILFAFENTKLFDDFVLRLISVGEQSNSLNITINEVEKIYSKRMEKAFKSFTTNIEPIFFILISTFIVWLMLAIFMPIWNLSDAMNM